MSTSVFTPEQLLREFPQRSFEDYASFESTLVDSFNRHRFDFPPGYKWRDVLDWALRSEILQREGSRIVVTLS
jgi:hypothetical protein